MKMRAVVEIRLESLIGNFFVFLLLFILLFVLPRHFTNTCIKSKTYSELMWIQTWTAFEEILPSFAREQGSPSSWIKLFCLKSFYSDKKFLNLYLNIFCRTHKPQYHSSELCTKCLKKSIFSKFTSSPNNVWGKKYHPLIN